MKQDVSSEGTTNVIVARAIRRFEGWQTRMHERASRMFARLFVVEWLGGIVLALTLSPYAWAGKTHTVHAHVWVAVFLGGAIAGFPIALATLKPAAPITRHVIAVGQMLFSALLIHLTGGRIETHFHVFGSLAFLAFFLDWKVLITAAITIAVEHFLRGLYFPESVYGVSNPEWWRFLEHGFWVAFCTGFLVYHCISMLESWLAFAEEGGMLEAMAESEWRARSVLEREASEQPPAREVAR